MKRTFHLSNTADDALLQMYIRLLAVGNKRTLSELVSQAILHYETHLTHVVVREKDKVPNALTEGWAPLTEEEQNYVDNVVPKIMRGKLKEKP